MMPPVADPSVFTDAQSLANLKREAAAHDPQALKAAAQQFESLFIDMMLKSARAADFKDPLFGSTQTRFYQGLYDQQIANDLSKSHAFGLAEMLVQQLRRQWTGQGKGVPNTGTPASATSVAVKTTPASVSAARRSAASSSSATVGPTSAPTASARTGGSAVTATQQTDFARSLWPDAQRAAQRLGVSPVSLIAQAALETDWGQHMPRTATGTSSNNLFGIKASGGWNGPSANSLTQEYRHGAASTIQAQFRAYGSCSQCFQDYATLLSTDPRYAAALGTGSNVHAFASALQQAGYATDPNYARKLTAVADTLSHTLASQSGTGPLKLARVSPLTPRSTTL